MTALLLLGMLLAGVTVGIAGIMGHPETTPEETQQAGKVGLVVFVALLVVAALGGMVVFGGAP